MRALEPFDVEILRAANGEGIAYCEGDPMAGAYDAAHDRLIARCCVVKVEVHEGWDFWITDLGRLALRVSLPIPGVTL